MPLTDAELFAPIKGGISDEELFGSLKPKKRLSTKPTPEEAAFVQQGVNFRPNASMVGSTATSQLGDPEEIAARSAHEQRIQQLQSGPMSTPVVGPVLGLGAQYGGALLGLGARATDLVTGGNNADAINRQTRDIGEAYNNLQGTGALGTINRGLSATAQFGVMGASGGIPLIAATSGNEGITEAKDAGLNAAQTAAYAASKATIMAGFGKVFKGFAGPELDAAVNTGLRAAIARTGASGFELTGLGAANKVVNQVAGMDTTGWTPDQVSHLIADSFTMAAIGQAGGAALNTGKKTLGTGYITKQEAKPATRTVVPASIFKTTEPIQGPTQVESKPVDKQPVTPQEVKPTPPPEPDIVSQATDGQLKQYLGKDYKLGDRKGNEDKMRKLMGALQQPVTAPQTPPAASEPVPANLPPETPPTQQEANGPAIPPTVPAATPGTATADTGPTPGPGPTATTEPGPVPQPGAGGTQPELRKPGPAQPAVEPGPPAQEAPGEPVRAPTPAPAEPVIEPGKVRFYHGGDAGGGKRWLTPSRKYAEGYAKKSGAPVSYVDIPEDSPLLQKAYDDTGTSTKAPYNSFEAPEDLARELKPLSQKAEPVGGISDHEMEVAQGLDDVSRYTGKPWQQVHPEIPPEAQGHIDTAKKAGLNVAFVAPTDGVKVKGIGGFAKGNTIFFHPDEIGKEMFKGIVYHEMSHATGFDLSTDIDKALAEEAIGRYLKGFDKNPELRAQREKDLQDPLLREREGKAQLVKEIVSDPSFDKEVERKSPSLWRTIRTLLKKVTGRYTSMDRATDATIKWAREINNRELPDATPEGQQQGSNQPEHQGIDVNQQVPTEAGGGNRPPPGGVVGVGPNQPPPETSGEPVRPQQPEDSGPASPPGPPGPGGGPEQGPATPGRKLANVGILPDTRAAIAKADADATAAGEPGYVSNKSVENAADARIAADRPGELEKALNTDPTKARENQVDDKVIERLRVSEEDRAQATGDPEAYYNAAKLRLIHRGGRTTTARILQQGRDPLNGKSWSEASPKERLDAINDILFSASGKLQSQIDQAMKDGNQVAVDKLLKQQAKLTKKNNETLAKYNIDPAEAAKDPLAAQKAVAQIKASQSSYADRAFEYFINAILSGLPTGTKKAVSDMAHGIHKYVLLDNAERLINLVTKDPTSKNFTDLPEQIRAGAIGASHGLADAVTVLKTGIPLEGDLFDNSHHSIPGKVGTVVRFMGSTRLQAITQFFNTLYGHMEVADEARKAAGTKGLTGQAFDDFVHQEVGDTNSDSWDRAKENAQKLTLSNPIKGGIYGGLKSIRDVSIKGFKPLQYVAPILGVPYKLGAGILRQAPVTGDLKNVYDLFQKAASNRESGRPTMQGINPTLAEGVVRWGTTLALYSAMSGANPLIVGNNPPPGRKARSIKIGDHEFEFGQLGIPGSVVALTADFAQTLGKSGSTAGDLGNIAIKAIASPLDEVKHQDLLRTVKDVSDLLGLSQSPAEAAANPPEERAKKFLSGFAANWVPNLYKSLSRATQENLGESKALDGQLENAAQRARLASQPTKYDSWGSPVPSNTTPFPGVVSPFIYRALSPFYYHQLSSHEGDAVLAQWNAEHPKEKPEEILPVSANYLLRGEHKTMSGKEYEQYVKLAGEKAQNYYIGNGAPATNPDKISPALVELVHQAQSRGREAALKQMFPGATTRESQKKKLGYAFEAASQ